MSNPFVKSALKTLEHQLYSGNHKITNSNWIKRQIIVEQFL